MVSCKTEHFWKYFCREAKEPLKLSEDPFWLRSVTVRWMRCSIQPPGPVLGSMRNRGIQPSFLPGGPLVPSLLHSSSRHSVQPIPSPTHFVLCAWKWFHFCPRVSLLPETPSLTFLNYLDYSIMFMWVWVGDKGNAVSLLPPRHTCTIFPCSELNCAPHSQFICWSPNPWYLRMWLIGPLQTWQK